MSQGYQRDRRFLLKRLRGIFISFYVDALSIRCLLKTSQHNKRKLLGKWRDPDFADQAAWVN
jgi:hypothetical protein